MSAPPGLAEERTALSWQRTGFGVLAVAGLLGHHAVRTGGPLLVVVTGATALMGLAILGVLAPLRYRRIRHELAAGTFGADRGAARAGTVVVVVAALAALVAVLPTG